MDSYVAEFQAAGASLVMLAKGNRSKAVKDSCKAHGGFYLGSVGGPAARLAQDCIRKVEVLEYPELGMEAVWRIEVENFPAFIVMDDKGNDFYDGLGACASPSTVSTTWWSTCKDVETERRIYQRVLGMEREEFGPDHRTALKFGGQKLNLRPTDADKRAWVAAANTSPGAWRISGFITATGAEDVVDASAQPSA